MKILLTFFIVIFSSPIFALSNVEEAVSMTGIKNNDTLESKIDKTLSLLNERNYFQPNSKIKIQIPSKYANNKYHLDSLRTPEEVLSQKIGGYCASTALAFAAILNSAGVISDDIQIVATVKNDDLKLICPQAGKPRVEHPNTGASGHVFVAVRFPKNNWIIINTIDGSKNYEKSNWYPPDFVQHKILNEALAIPIETYKNLPPSYISGLTVFQSWALSEVPLHTFDQRLDLIASGNIKKTLPICRFTAPLNH